MSASGSSKPFKTANTFYRPMTHTGLAAQLLKAAGATVGDTVRIQKGHETHTGVLMPRHEFSDEAIITLKLPSGYNIGLRVTQGSTVAMVSKKETKGDVRKKLPRGQGRKDVAVISTGGTIASYVDYRTGAVHPAKSADELVFSVPELMDLCNVRAKVLYSILSENMTVAHWQGLARAVAEELNSGAVGAIVPHGTDTMGFTAAALSFMLKNLTGPVVCVGSQRSSDRPSSDATMNLLAATRLCVDADLGEVVVMMHGEPSDSYCLAHRGTKVRKMHSSRRDAFASMNIQPIARVEGSEVRFNGHHLKRSEGPVEVRDKIDGRASLLHFYPGFEEEHFDLIANHVKGVVVAGTGLGHVSDPIISSIRKAVKRGVHVVVTTQCLQGTVNLNVYSTGRDMISAGALPVGDMLPETAYVKLMWAMGQTDDYAEVNKLMLTNIAGELTDRREL